MTRAHVESCGAEPHILNKLRKPQNWPRLCRSPRIFLLRDLQLQCNYLIPTNYCEKITSQQATNFHSENSFLLILKYVHEIPAASVSHLL